MSLASIRIAGRLLAVAALAALTAGCFQPMYAEHADGTPGLREKLMGVELPPVNKPNSSRDARLGVAIRNALADILARPGQRAADLTPDLTWAIREAAVILVQLFAPMMPHLAEACWVLLGQPGLVSEADWPKIERDLLVEETVTLVVQVNGKKRGEVTVARTAQNPEIEAAVLALDAVKQSLGDKPVRKVIVVPMRIVNVVG